MSENLYRQTLNFRKNNLFQNDPNIGSTMNNLAGVLYKQNRLQQSAELYRETLKFRKENLLPNHPDIGTSMNNLAGVLKDQNLL